MVVRKLKSSRGASIIIALLVLLICVTAGTAALTAASANAGRYSHARRDQQRYLAVASAARMVRDELCGAELSVSVKSYLVLDADDPSRRVVEVDPNTGLPNYTYSPPACTGSAFGPWLKDAFAGLSDPADLLDAGGLPVPNVTCTDLGFDVAEDDTGMLEKVKWELQMEEDYTLRARFWLEEDGEEYYPTLLTIPAAEQPRWLDATERDTSVARERWIVTRSASIVWPASGAVITKS